MCKSENGWYFIDVTISVEFDTDTIDKIMAKAIVGSMHWCKRVELSDDSNSDIFLQEFIGNNVSLLFYHYLSKDLAYELTLEKLLHGLFLWANKHSALLPVFHGWNWELYEPKISELQADMILQYALFGKVLYDPYDENEDDD